MTKFEQIQKEFKGIEGYVQDRITFNHEFGNNDDHTTDFVDYINVDLDYIDGYSYSESSSGCYEKEFRIKLSEFLENNKYSHEDLIKELIKIKNGYKRYK